MIANAQPHPPGSRLQTPPRAAKDYGFSGELDSLATQIVISLFSFFLPSSDFLIDPLIANTFVTTQLTSVQAGSRRHSGSHAVAV